MKILTVLLVLLFTVLPFKITKTNEFKPIEKILDIQIPTDSTLVNSIDSHGGFHGDGESYIEISLTDEGFQSLVHSIEKNEKWSNFPLSKDVQKTIYTGEFDGVYYYRDGLSSNIPTDIENGFYFIRDRFAERYPEEKDINLHYRYSYNVSIGIIDMDSKKIYFYELDT